MVGQTSSSTTTTTTTNTTSFSHLLQGHKPRANLTTPTQSRTHHLTQFTEALLELSTPISVPNPTLPSESSDESKLIIDHILDSSPWTTSTRTTTPPSHFTHSSEPSPPFAWDCSLNFHSHRTNFPAPLSPNEEEMVAFEKRTGYLICTPDETTKMALFSLGF